MESSTDDYTIVMTKLNETTAQIEALQSQLNELQDDFNYFARVVRIAFSTASVIIWFLITVNALIDYMDRRRRLNDLRTRLAIAEIQRDANERPPTPIDVRIAPEPSDSSITIEEDTTAPVQTEEGTTASRQV